uniref:Sulfurtransferase n=1 Tax=Candidatus Aschnera chinzeii TaxID=1485666 RepID=A0AAT9G4R6_9ENTR|nr:MAG: sulfurtransferase TusE [Candidatus Aschnera chinzeii]
MCIIKGKKIEFDVYGYLKDRYLWNESIAIFLAKQENIVLTKHHWEIIFFIRKFYFQFNTLPHVRLLVNLIAKKYGKKIGNSNYLYFLFPKGPAQQAIKLAGLPKPVKCI